ncbi:NYN domain-containing protein [Brevundimonas sp.]|uniref:NYN domain-containing protein n=1 Tax=Brevundimonas sp. TaxID=1871086 RepID=UPI00289D51B9|nr:NYN domain-containing protein [Brevundimonas sp.]
MPDEAKPLKLAVLIDGENASARIVEVLFTEIATLGEATARRIYGDAASLPLKNWVEILPKWALQWQQNFQNTKGKNSGDIALVIDAMDLMHSGRFDGFCIVSSDSDFTRLAARIREQGLPVFGFGEHKTPESFRQACTRFIYTENLLPATEPLAPAAAPVAQNKKSRLNDRNHAQQLIINALSDADEGEDGWASLGVVGNRLRSTYPDFDHRTYGQQKLSDLIRTLPKLEITRSDGNGLKVRTKPVQSPKPKT